MPDGSRRRVRSIETSYAGCRFRSRLEARYAVFFDALNIAWDYEPQGFEVGGDPSIGDCGTGPGPIRYLPDFWLPDLGLWVEVKGDLRRVDLHTLCLASLPPGRGGLPFGGPDDDSGSSAGSPNRLRLLILTGIPRLPSDHWCVPVHWCLSWNKGDVLAERFEFMFNGDDVQVWTEGGAETVWRDDGGGLTLPFTTPLLGRITRGGEHAVQDHGDNTRRLRDAYTAARSVRFEFGQTPRSRPRPRPAVRS